MRILLVSGSAYPCIGGVENSLRYIASELVQHGHEVKVFCLQLDSSEPLNTECEGIEIIRCKYRRSRWSLSGGKDEVNLVRREIRGLLADFKPDCIWSRKSTIGLGVALSGYKGKLVHMFPTTARMSWRGRYVGTQRLNLPQRLKILALLPIRYRSMWHIERVLLKRCQPVVFSENMRRQLQRSYGALAKKTRVIQPGVDTNCFSPEAGQQQLNKIKSQYSLEVSEPLILFVGRLSVEKHVYFLVDSLKHIQQSARLVVVGSGPEETRLHHYIEKRNLAARVIFVGQQYELLPGFYTIARVCVLPTLIESFGQVYLESLACGTPVVGFAADGRKVINATDEIVQDGKTGRIVREVSPKALADGINDVLALSLIEYQAMSECAVADVSQRFSWKRFVKEVLAI